VVSGISLSERPLIGTLLENEEYITIYHEYMQEIADEYFNSGTFEKSIEKIDEMISEYVKNDATAFYTADEYAKAVETLKIFGKLRAESIQGQLDGTVPATSESQELEPENLIDASSLNISDMGSQDKGAK
jgi:hypothetical protein